MSVVTPGRPRIQMSYSEAAKKLLEERRMATGVRTSGTRQNQRGREEMNEVAGSCSSRQRLAATAEETAVRPGRAGLPQIQNHGTRAGTATSLGAQTAQEKAADCLPQNK